MNTRKLALATGALAALLLLTGCAAGPAMDGMDQQSNSPSDSTAPVNDADSDFAVNMIDHHQQAIDMADLLLAKEGVDDRVINLALAIKEAQGPEISTMTAWLDAWGQDIMPGMDHGGGMMSDDDMSALEAATGAEATRLFLEQMIEHHQGAIDMAEREVTEGENPDAVALAGAIITDQTAEITVMQQLLTSV
jgi:uncharacterized protein (DUF305 family)